MNRFWKIAGLATLVAVLALASVAAVSADPTQGDRFSGSFSGRGRNSHAGHGMNGMKGSGNSLIAVAAEKLDMTIPELHEALEDGRTIADLAQEKGVELQDIADAWLAERAEILSQAVADGRITQEQADEMLEHMGEEVLEHLQATWPWTHDHEECGEHMLEGFGGFGARKSERSGARGFGQRGSSGGCGR